MRYNAADNKTVDDITLQYIYRPVSVPDFIAENCVWVVTLASSQHTGVR